MLLHSEIENFNKGDNTVMAIYSSEVESMCVVAKGPDHGPAPLPEEGKWIQAKEIKDISGFTVWAGAHRSRAHVSCP